MSWVMHVRVLLFCIGRVRTPVSQHTLDSNLLNTWHEVKRRKFENFKYKKMQFRIIYGLIIVFKVLFEISYVPYDGTWMICKLVTNWFPSDSLLSLENVSDMYDQLLGPPDFCYLTGLRMGVVSFLLKESLAPLQTLLSPPKYRWGLFLQY